MPFPPGMEYSWEQLRRRQYWFWGTFLTYLPAGALTAVMARRFTDSEVPLCVTAGIWMVAFLTTGLRLNRARCPRCQRPFFSRGFFGHSNVFARRCLNCGLGKYAKSDAEVPGSL